jgi:DNA-binding Lrp family transcriptional regulator
MGKFLSLAYVMMNTIPDKMEAVLKEVKKIDGIEDAFMLYGVYDIIAKVKVKTTEELKVTILNIRKLRNVTSTLTLRIVY